MRRFYLSILILTFFSFTYTNTGSKYSKEITIKNNEECSPSDYLNTEIKSLKISQFKSQIGNSVIIKYHSTDSCTFDDLLTYLSKNQEFRGPNYFDILSSTHTISDITYSFKLDNGEYDWKKIKGLKTYYHKLFQNKSARNLMFNELVSYLSLLCENYPSDFKLIVLNEIASLIEFTKDIDNNEVDNYWKGFVYRRIKTDKVPIKEISSNLIELKNKILQIKTNDSIASLFSLNINQDISIKYFSQKTEIVSFNSKRKILLEGNSWINTVKFMQDSSGNYYVINGYDKGKPFNKLYDSNLTLIN